MSITEVATTLACMAEMAELGVATRVFMRAYRWRRVDPVPWAPLRKPLREARVALLSSAGFCAPGQEPFDDQKKGGDASFREIADDTRASDLFETHRSQAFDHSGLGEDPNLGFPIYRLHELVEAGEVGCAAPRHLSFMGSITAPGRLTARSAPEAVAKLVEDGVDAALLVPV